MYFLVQHESTIDPQTERWKSVNEENQRLQHELSDMHRKFETLNTRNDSSRREIPTNPRVFFFTF